jgi:sugar phosphate isomerase/epimerase
MIFGAITNSWRQQLESRDLMDLVEQAGQLGARHIELRQTCLGRCEDGSGEDWRPNLDRLAGLVDAHPSLTFDLAMALPCLTQMIDPQGEGFQAALASAKLVGKAQAHLRLVDPRPFDAPWESPEDIPAEALNVAASATEAARQSVVMSIENSGQPIRSLAMLVKAARARMSPAHAPYLGLCPDPTNQLRRFPGSDPLEELDALPLDMIKIVHFKQLRNGEPHGSVDDGDLNCLRMRDILNAKGYAGPAIMEIPPAPDVFDNLAASFRYLGS